MFDFHIFTKFALVILLVSCTDRERSNPLDPKNLVTLGRPTGLNVISIQDTVFLNWDILKLNDLAGYQIYRRTGVDTGFVSHAFVSAPSNTFREFGLAFDVEYEYQISAGGDTFESLRSEVVKIIPGPTFTWVTEKRSQQVIKLTHDSRHLILRTERFSTIIDIEPNPITGELWVLDIFAGIESNLKKITPNGKIDDHFIPFDRPTDVSLDYNSNTIWVADPPQSTVTKLDSIGNILFTVHTFATPILVTTDQRNGNCWVADSQTNTASRILSDGSEVMKSGVQFDSIVSMEVNSVNGSVWLVGATKVVKIDENGDFLLEINSPLTSPEKLAINENSGDVWIINESPANLYKFSSSGEMLLDVAGPFTPADISVNKFDNNLLVSDVFGHTVYRLSSDGEILSFFKDLTFPDLIGVQNQGRTN